MKEKYCQNKITMYYIFTSYYLLYPSYKSCKGVCIKIIVINYIRKWIFSKKKSSQFSIQDLCTEKCKRLSNCLSLPDM